MAIDSKINNIIGSKLPQWLLYQLETRANQNSLDNRTVGGTSDNIIYLGNKSAWVRVISSVDIDNLKDLNYFKNTVGATANAETNAAGTIKDPSSLAKEYILYGGTSKYLNKNSYQIRSGLGSNGAYGMLGEQEIKQFGYKPMPGINSISIETQGRLGSLRAATITFKCWDKNQLDIIDALYFKLGYTMFIEWGNTFFYPSKKRTIDSLNITLDPSKINSTELFAIDPFEQNLTKEQILSKIAKSTRETEGNYDAMLGICTNFNFTYTQDGGYDCTLKIMALGILGDSIKINNSGTLPNLLEEEIKIYNNTLAKIEKAKRDAAIAAARQQETDDLQKKSQIKSEYLPCIQNLPGADLAGPLRVDNTGPYFPYAYQATINNVKYYFYIDKRYQTQDFTKSGTYDCVNNILYIDGKDATLPFSGKTLEEYIKETLDYNYKNGVSVSPYWPASKPLTKAATYFVGADLLTQFPIDQSKTPPFARGYLVRRLSAIIPADSPLNEKVKIKLDSTKINRIIAF